MTNRQIEAARRAMTRHVKRGGKIWIRVFPDHAFTKKPAETRMGSGKGQPEGWVAVVLPGRVLFEMAGVTREIAKEAMRLAAHKLPIQTRFVVREETGADLEAGTHDQADRCAQQLRGMTVSELDDHLRKQRGALFQVRLQQATGQVENHRQVREIRQEIARAMTVRIEIERGLRPALVEAVAAQPVQAKAKPARAPRVPKAAKRLEVPAVVPAAVPVAETPEPAEAVAETVDAEEDVDE